MVRALSVRRTPPLSLRSPMLRSIVALPAKGRVRENVDALLAATALEVPARRQFLSRSQPRVSVARMDASAIASGLALGRLSLGLTGLDLMLERGLSHGFSHVDLCCRFDLSSAHIRVMVPKSFTSIRTVNDLHKLTLLGTLRVASKYKLIATRFLLSQGLRSFVVMDPALSAESDPTFRRCHAIVDVMTSTSTAHSNFLKPLVGRSVLKTSLCSFRHHGPTTAADELISPNHGRR
ncbi:MAG: hypothetical protein ACKER6_00115 [Candidatus Hodgkinia cicadicola]